MGTIYYEYWNKILESHTCAPLRFWTERDEHILCCAALPEPTGEMLIRFHRPSVRSEVPLFWCGLSGLVCFPPPAVNVSFGSRNDANRIVGIRVNRNKTKVSALMEGYFRNWLLGSAWKVIVCVWIYPIDGILYESTGAHDECLLFDKGLQRCNPIWNSENLSLFWMFVGWYIFSIRDGGRRTNVTLMSVRLCERYTVKLIPMGSKRANITIGFDSRRNGWKEYFPIAGFRRIIF